MEIASLILHTAIWPAVVLFALYYYRDLIAKLLSQSKIKFTISGFTIETTLAQLETSVSEGLRGRKLTPDQWDWLKRLRDEGRMPYSELHYDTLRPLRNAGLIKEHPEGWLSTAQEIEITTLGKLLLEAKESQYGR